MPSNFECKPPVLNLVEINSVIMQKRQAHVFYAISSEETHKSRSYTHIVMFILRRYVILITMKRLDQKRNIKQTFFATSKDFDIIYIIL